MSDDLITALVLTPTRVEWTTLRRRKGAVEVVEQREKPLPPAATGESPSAAAARLKQAVAGIKGRIAAALSIDQVLLRVVRLPTADLAEIREMAELQVDKFSPFPVEQMVVSQEVLAQQDGASRVLIAATLRENVDRLGETLRAAGLVAREVDISVLGWLRLFKQENRIPAEGRLLLMIVEERGTELIVLQDGVPVMLRSLAGVGDANAESAAEEVAEEINYTLTTLESEWGLQTPGALQVWHRKGLPPTFLSALSERVEIALEPHPLDSLQPVSEGLARRAMERGPHLLDLAPSDWRATIASQRFKRNLLVAGLAFFTVWLLAVAALVVLVKLQQRRLANTQHELAALRDPAQAVEQIKEQVRALERYLDPTFSALECLREISERIPPGVDITALTYKKYGQVALRGEAENSDPIYDFFQALEKTELFPEVKPEGVTQQQRGGRAKSQFKVTINLPGEAK